MEQEFNESFEDSDGHQIFLIDKTDEIQWMVVKARDETYREAEEWVPTYDNTTLSGIATALSDNTTVILGITTYPTIDNIGDNH